MHLPAIADYYREARHYVLQSCRSVDMVVLALEFGEVVQ